MQLWLASRAREGPEKSSISVYETAVAMCNNHACFLHTCALFSRVHADEDGAGMNVSVAIVEQPLLMHMLLSMLTY